MRGESILVVDDNATNLKLMRVLLSKAGYDVHTSASAIETLVTLKWLRPHLILLDLQLPDVDGLTLTHHLKEDPKTHDIPIVALTAHAMAGDEQKALAAGCDGYVTKPVDSEVILDYLARRFGSTA
ncbi:MAG TPA: response regulator [Gemmatimonadaceae bacterium]|nr:response regulator [Gemmatimonadaceae bacterium]